MRHENRTAAVSEFIVAGFALLALLVAQWSLSAAIHGSNYYGVDGKMAQATVLSTLKFGRVFDITNISPIQGVGSQMLTKNAWANPAFWPFAFLDKEVATDVSALVALGIFAIACYMMMRCFDVPTLPSAIAAQLCIVLFAPALLIVHTPTNFCLTPGDAVAYAPFMVVVGLLARLQLGSWRAFAFITSGMAALLFYSLYCDPLWMMVAAMGWAVPSAVVVFGPRRLQTIVIRASALASCLAVFLVTGALSYMYTVSRYTARVQFAGALDRERSMIYVSAVTYSPTMRHVYALCMVGWLLGFVTLRGRSQLLVVAGAVSFTTYLAYSVVYLLLQDAAWVPPIPIYVEQCLIPLYLAGAVTGYWGALERVASYGRDLGLTGARCLHWPSQIAGVTILAGLVVASIIPARVIRYAAKDAKPRAETFYVPWPDEPELLQFFVNNVGLNVGAPFRGSVNSLAMDEATGPTIAHMWSHAIPTANEYSQLVTPQALYFVHKLLNKDIRGNPNRFEFSSSDGSRPEVYWKALQMLGVRYAVERSRLPDEFNPGYSVVTFTRRPHAGDRTEGLWHVYELRHPNRADYSPTEVMTAASGAEIMSKLGTPGFDFARQVVLSTPLRDPLVQARDLRILVTRGGWHVSGTSNGTSLIVLPQQFSNCLRARDGRVRLVRANLMMTGMMFAGDVDTDIVFDYGIFTPGCRWSDLADMKHLHVTIDLRKPHLSGNRLFPDWDGVASRLRTAMSAIQ